MLGYYLYSTAKPGGSILNQRILLYEKWCSKLLEIKTIYIYIYIYIYSPCKSNNYSLKSAQYKSIIILWEED